MAWQALHISRPARLSSRDGQLIVANDDRDPSVFPLEDLACLILDTAQVTMTGALLSSLSTSGVCLIVTDARHHPSGVMTGFHQHYAQSQVASRQVV